MKIICVENNDILNKVLHLLFPHKEEKLESLARFMADLLHPSAPEGGYQHSRWGATKYVESVREIKINN